MQKSLAEKMFKIQETMKPIVREENNPHFKAKYYDINGQLSVLKPLLNATKLLVLQPLTFMSDGKQAISTVIIDGETGDEFITLTPMPIVNDIQKFGAAVTYMRRYALTSLFLLEAEDDDGETAVGRGNAVVANSAPVTSAPSIVPTGRECVMCHKNFTPDPKFPRASTCSWQCATAKKTQLAIEANKPPVETEPQLPIDDNEVLLEDLPF